MLNKIHAIMEIIRHITKENPRCIVSLESYELKMVLLGLQALQKETKNNLLNLINERMVKKLEIEDKTIMKYWSLKL